MTAMFTTEQREMRSVLRAALSESATDQQVWQTLTGELGLTALLVPAQRDGLGLGPVELLVVAEELGRALRGGEFLTTGVLGAALLAGLSTAPAEHLLARLVTGDLRLAVLTETHSSVELLAGDPAPGQGCTVTLEAGPVLGADRAGVLLVPGRADGQSVLVAVDTAASGVTLSPTPCLDDTRGFAAITLAAATGTIVAVGDQLADQLAHAMLLARLYLAGEAGGGADWCLNAATEYASIRTQFGRPIGSFQAIKHLCADLLVDVEGCKSMSRLAAAQLANGASEAANDVDLALLHAAGAFDRVASGAMHVFGGIGFTWEHPAHRYVKRALTTASLLEPAEQVRIRVAARVHSHPSSPKEA